MAVLPSNCSDGEFYWLPDRSSRNADAARSWRPVQQPVRDDHPPAQAELPLPFRWARYERLVFDANDQLIVPLNESYLLMKGIGADRTRETYLAMLRPWFGFLTKQGYQWNTRPEPVRENTRLFLLEAGCARSLACSAASSP